MMQYAPLLTQFNAVIIPANHELPIICTRNCIPTNLPSGSSIMTLRDNNIVIDYIPSDKVQTSMDTDVGTFEIVI